MKAIIFDCFGVLIGRGFWNVYKSLGGDLEADAEFIDEQLQKVDLGEISGHEFSELMANRLHMPVDMYLDTFAKDEKPNEDVFDYIQHELKPHYKLALVSNATGDSVRKRIPEDKMALFDEVFISGEVGILKPDPRLFKMALRALDVDANDAVFVDDHQEYIDGAVAVGLHTILFTSLEDFKLKLQTLL
ncbi:MAG TPA: HAD-IA family hydrolase [Candidatus Saccharibacteria bacterium]|nr:HAD-IA family hydrolase [Candidatus Saccharibacteria bacterium]